MNELRSQINTERGQFVTRDMLDQRGHAVDIRFAEISRSTEQRFDELNKRIGDAERSRANLDGRFSMLAMVLGGMTVLLNLLFGYLTRH